MNIAITGQAERIAELKTKISSACNIKEFDLKDEIPGSDLIIDLNFDDHPEMVQTLLRAQKPLLLSAVKIQLAAVVPDSFSHVPVFGINALPALVSRDLTEVSALKADHKTLFEQFSATIGIKPKWVEDRVGMVTPRVLFMIINEAYYTVQEGTAGKADIDTAMKLGTAYPFGPFEFVERIGLKNIYETLDAVFKDTGDTRYKICPLLKTEYFGKVRV